MVKVLNFNVLFTWVNDDPIIRLILVNHHTCMIAHLGSCTFYFVMLECIYYCVIKLVILLFFHLGELKLLSTKSIRVLLVLSVLNIDIILPRRAWISP